MKWLTLMQNAITTFVYVVRGNTSLWGLAWSTTFSIKDEIKERQVELAQSYQALDFIPEIDSRKPGVVSIHSIATSNNFFCVCCWFFNMVVAVLWCLLYTYILKDSMCEIDGRGFYEHCFVFAKENARSNFWQKWL